MPATTVERRRDPSASSAITRYRPQATRIVTATVRASVMREIEVVDPEQIAGNDPCTEQRPGGYSEPGDAADEALGSPRPAARREREEERRDADRQVAASVSWRGSSG